MIYNLQDHYPFKINEAHYRTHIRYRYDYDNIILAQAQQRVFKIKYLEDELSSTKPAKKKKIYKKLKQLKRKQKLIMIEYPEYFI